MSPVSPVSAMTGALPGLAVIGGGPAGLMAAEVARAAGVEVDLFEAKGSVGRKFLIAGKGGLNLTHAEPMPGFARRYGPRGSAPGVGRGKGSVSGALASCASAMAVRMRASNKVT